MFQPTTECVNSLTIDDVTEMLHTGLLAIGLMSERPKNF